MVPSGINVPPGKFGKNNKRTPWNNRTPLKTKMWDALKKNTFLVRHLLTNLKAIQVKYATYERSYNYIQ